MQTCPSCGYCPACGRRNMPTIVPSYPYVQPMYPSYPLYTTYPQHFIVTNNTGAAAPVVSFAVS